MPYHVMLDVVKTVWMFQEKDINVLSRTKRIQGHGHQFCADWYNNYCWLVLCTTRLQAFCAVC